VVSLSLTTKYTFIVLSMLLMFDKVALESGVKPALWFNDVIFIFFTDVINIIYSV
jgi:hypothetical protein